MLRFFQLCACHCIFLLCSAAAFGEEWGKGEKEFEEKSLAMWEERKYWGGILTKAYQQGCLPLLGLGL